MKMGPSTTKKADRAERKKKKLNALLEITKLNDRDRNKELSSINLQDEKLIKPAEEKEDGEIEDSCLVGDGPSRKRYKRNDGHMFSLSPTQNEGDEKANIEFDHQFTLPPPTEERKRELRERKNRLKILPRIMLNEMGDKASLLRDRRTPIFISDIQQLIMYSQLGHHSPVKPRWCFVEKFNRISRTIVLLVEGATVYDFLSTESTLPNLSKVGLKVEIVSPITYNENLVEELAAVPLSGTQKRQLEKKYGSLRQAEQKSGLVFRILRAIFPIELPPNNSSNCLPMTDRFPRTDLLLSAWQMIEEGYPIPLNGELKDRYSDYVMSKEKYAEVTPKSPMWGLDCEMCYTLIKKNEVTRVSIVNENLEVMYESLVMPPNKIINYLTEFSGITPQMMKGVTKTLEDVQADLRRLFPPDLILVGQSLNFDLHALKIMHPYVIDTSVIYNLYGVRSRKSKLSILSSTFLGENIQGGYGHDSVEDSSSSLKLVQLKLANSVEFGDAVLCGPISYTPCQPMERPRPKASDKREEILVTSLFSHVTRDKKTASVVGKREVLTNYETFVLAPTFDSQEGDMLVTCLSVEDNAMAIKKACYEAKYRSFVVAHVKLEEGESLAEVDRWTGDLLESAEANAFVLVVLAGTPYSRSHGACFLALKRLGSQPATATTHTPPSSE